MSTGPLQLAERRASVPRPSDFQVESEILFHLSLLQTPGGKLRCLAARLFVPTPADCRFLRLPPSLFFLYYLLRPIRVACKAVEWVVCFDFRGWITASLLLSPASASKLRPDDGSGQTLDLTNDFLDRRIEGGLQDYQAPLLAC